MHPKRAASDFIWLIKIKRNEAPLGFLGGIGNETSAPFVYHRGHVALKLTSGRRRPPQPVGNRQTEPELRH